MVIESAPASAKASICRSGASIIRWTSRTPPASWTRSAIEAATSGPIVIGGTKWPSITSKWITRAPAAITSSSWEPSREKSAERIDGATRRSASSSRHPLVHTCLSIESPHIWQVMSSLVLIRAIVWCSPQFGHCETSSKRRRQYTQRKRPGKLRRPQPGLVAAGAFGSPQHRSIAPRLDSSLSIIPSHPADEETGGAIAVGSQLQAAAVVG